MHSMLVCFFTIIKLKLFRCRYDWSHCIRLTRRLGRYNINSAIIIIWYTDETVDIKLECSVVALFGVVEMDKEENVRPDVMFLVDVVLETLYTHNTDVTLTCTFDDRNTHTNTVRNSV